MNPSRFHRRTPKITPENPRIFTAAPKIKRKSSCRDTKFIAPRNDDDNALESGENYKLSSLQIARLLAVEKNESKSKGGRKRWLFAI